MIPIIPIDPFMLVPIYLAVWLMKRRPFSEPWSVK